MITLLDPLYCEENHQCDDDDDEQPVVIDSYNYVVDENNNKNINNVPQENLCWDPQELTYLISKQSHQPLHHNHNVVGSSHNHCEAVEWILGVVSHYSFKAQTAVLAVNYLDRFIVKFEDMEIEKKVWMAQLAAVACLSIAAKVGETYVPLLLDLQIDRSKHVFEPNSVIKMEILILSTLEWKMNPVTPLSFLDYITRRFGLSSCLSSEFIKRCECLLLCFLSDGRLRCYLPSVIATSTMVLVISSVEPCIVTEFKVQLVGILDINKEDVEECLKKIQEVTCGKNSGGKKRKFELVPRSPDGVMGLSFSSDESWSSVVNPYVSTSPHPWTSSQKRLE